MGGQASLSPWAVAVGLSLAELAGAGPTLTGIVSDISGSLSRGMAVAGGVLLAGAAVAFLQGPIRRVDLLATMRNSRDTF